MSRKTYVILALVVVLAACAATGFYWQFLRNNHTETFPGVVEIQEVRLGSKVAGRVESVSVDEGDHVKAGAELVRFEVPELVAQGKQLNARIGEAEADVQKLKDGYEPEIKAARAAYDSAAARRDRLVNGPRPEEKEQAKGELDAAEAALQQAQSDMTRATKMFQANAIGRAEYDTARSVLEQAQGRAEAARAKVKLLAKNRKEDIDEAEAEASRAQANLELLKITRKEDIKVAEQRLAELKGELEGWHVNMDEMVVTAKEPCVVEVLAVRKGDLVAAGQLVVRVLRDEDLWVKAYVPETKLDLVQVGQEVDVVIDSGKTFQGTVIKVNSQSEFTPRNVQSADERKHQMFGIKVRVKNDGGALKPGMAAQVVIPSR